MCSNDVVGETVYTDNTALEDARQFQDIGFEIINGYYFNEGHSDNIKQVIKHLYTQRNNKNKARTQHKQS